MRDQQSGPCRPLEACNCLEQIKTDMKVTLENIVDPTNEIAVALFECFEAMQHFDYNSELS